ncbi:MAG: peptide chain release factor N(5)-glutamine methyltransferase [Candidatus Colwellbacteria bacterium]|nr:peptide chain release factor N(5)-glutamine methyltransferase [Candidatus Colwellbacteria bacterium]
MRQSELDIRFIIKDKYDGRRDARGLARDRARLARGEPLAYVIGWVPFLGCRIALSRRVLIPRSETEWWVQEVIRSLDGRRGAALNVLDLFAGSGCIGTAILKHLPRALVTFADVSESALEQSAANAHANGIARHRYASHRSNIFSAFGGRRFDLILANPPYIPANGTSRVEHSVLKYEPRRALFGGADGLALIRRFVRTVGEHLADAGEVWMEFHPRQARSIEKLLREAGFGRSVFSKDQYGRLRYVRFRP